MLPVETILAVFPSAVAVGNITLRPLTLYHAVAFEMLGIDIGSAIDDEHAYQAAWLLTKTPDEIASLMSDTGIDLSILKEWMAKTDAATEEVTKAVNRVVNTGLATNVPGKASKETLSFMPTGYGWPLEIAEALCHEYAMRFAEAMSMPLSQAFGLMACARIRNGGKAGGPDYYERMQLNAIRQMRIAEEMAKESEAEHGEGDNV